MQSNEFRPTLVVLAAATLLTGVAYPLLVTGVAQLVFPAQANGSPIMAAGQTKGLAWIAQPLVGPHYFVGRPGTQAVVRDGGLLAASGGSNLGPRNPQLRTTVEQRLSELRKQFPLAAQISPPPLWLATASASGLDPQIPLDAALWQVPDVAAARHLSTGEVRELVMQHVAAPPWASVDGPVVTVLPLDVALDALAARH